MTESEYSDTNEHKKKAKKAKKAKKSKNEESPSEAAAEVRNADELRESEQTKEQQPSPLPSPEAAETEKPQPVVEKPSIEPPAEEARNNENDDIDDIDDTLEVNLHPEKSKWELSDEEPEPAAADKVVKKDQVREEASPDANDDDEKRKKKKKAKKQKRPSVDQDQSGNGNDNEQQPKKKKKKKKDDKDRKLKKLLLEKLSTGDSDPAMVKLALTLLGDPDKAAAGSDSRHSPSPPPRKKSSPKRSVIADGKNSYGQNFTVTVGGRTASSPASKSRKVSRGRSRSKSPVTAAAAVKKKSIKERLGPVDITTADKPSFKNDHWNGKSKPGKNERNGGAGHHRRSPVIHDKERKRDHRDSS